MDRKTFQAQTRQRMDALPDEALRPIRIDILHHVPACAYDTALAAFERPVTES